MENTLNIALKEWSATIDALACGDQLFLLRKGGIRETNRHFELANRRFLLYPTHFHEAHALLKPKFQHLIGSQCDVAHDTVEFKVWAEVADVLSVDRAQHLDLLFDSHVWTEEFVAKRVAWKPRHAASLILLRTYELLEPVSVPIEPHHKGCKSWVDIEPAVDVSGSVPVLKESDWNERAQEIQGLIQEMVPTQ